MSSMLLLLLLSSAVLVVGDTNASANVTSSNVTSSTASSTAAQSFQRPESWQIWSLDPQALAAAGCNETDAAKVQLCEARKQASLYHTRGMSAAEEWCVEVYVTVPCWPPCFCNHSNDSNSNGWLGYAWAKKHLEGIAQACTALPACTQTVAKATETPEDRPALAAAARACPVVHVWVLLMVFVVSALYECITT